jgi:hypothetical protein
VEPNTSAPSTGETLSRGGVYHYYSDLAQKGKYLVTLNHAWPPENGVVVYAYCTSQTDYFSRAQVPESMIVRLEPGSYRFCNRATVIDLTNIMERPLEEITNARMFKHECQLAPEHITAIDAAVRVSTRIARRHKRMILGAL